MNIGEIIVAPVVVVLITAWLLGFFNRFVPPPSRAWLALNNARIRAPRRSDTGFRIVLCWLENDRDGADTDNVEDAFANIEGVTLVRSARIVTASGASNAWREGMQRGTRAVLEVWNGDLAIVGLVKRPGEVLSLWLVPRQGRGTLGRGDQPYKLEDVTLGEDFHEDLRAQLTAVALVAVAPLADNELRGRVLDTRLREAIERLSELINSEAIRRPEHRVALLTAHGRALLTLGVRESNPHRIELAVEANRAALRGLIREDAPLAWAAVQNNLGNALSMLGEREAGTERSMEAVVAYEEALEERRRRLVPLEWAATQSNLGNALRTLGLREGNARRLEEATTAYRAALEEYTLDREPLSWSMIQNNLGNVLKGLGERQGSTERLGEAVTAHRAALTIRTRERVPLDWAMSESNLGSALFALGGLAEGSDYLEEAVRCFRAALQERTRDRTPFEWATTQFNLGSALLALGEREEGTDPGPFFVLIG